MPKVIKEPMCLQCMYSVGHDFGYCDAFYPKRIPDAILEGNFDHTKPWPGGGDSYQFVHVEDFQEEEAI